MTKEPTKKYTAIDRGDAIMLYDNDNCSAFIFDKGEAFYVILEILNVLKKGHDEEMAMLDEALELAGIDRDDEG